MPRFCCLVACLSSLFLPKCAILDSGFWIISEGYVMPIDRLRWKMLTDSFNLKMTISIIDDQLV